MPNKDTKEEIKPVEAKQEEVKQEDLLSLVKSLQKQVETLTERTSSVKKRINNNDKFVKLKIFGRDLEKGVMGNIAIAKQPYPNGETSLETIEKNGLRMKFIVKNILIEDSLPETIEVTSKEMAFANTSIIAKVIGIDKKEIEEEIGSVPLHVFTDYENFKSEEKGNVPVIITSAEYTYTVEFVDNRFPEFLGKQLIIKAEMLNLF